MKNKLGKIYLPKWLIILLVVVFLLRVPSYFEPYSYGDEMIYLTLGQGVRAGIPLYSGLHDNKPPLLYLTAAIAGNLFWFKAILTFWSMGTIVIFSKLLRFLYPKNKALQIIATIVLAILTTIPLLEGNIANAEVFMIGPTIAAFYLLLTRKGSWPIFAAGILFSIAALFKIPSAFELPVILVVWLANIKSFDKKNLIIFAKRSLILVAGFALPITLTFVWYWAQGAAKEYFIAAYAQNFGYVSSWRPGDVQKPFLEKNAPLLIRAAIVAAITVLLLLKKRLFSKQFVFAVIWLVFALFAVTLSERPYPHYLIQAVPAISILAAMLVAKKTYEQVLVLIPLALALFVPVYYHFWHYPTLPYYVRFANFSLGKINNTDYLKSYGNHIPSIYKISEYLISSTGPEDKIFVWGDTGTIYALTRRFPPVKYVADYHIRDFSSYGNLIVELDHNKPKFIVVLKDSNPPSELQVFLSHNYALTENINDSKIFRLLGEKIKSLI